MHQRRITTFSLTASSLASQLWWGTSRPKHTNTCTHPPLQATCKHDIPVSSFIASSFDPPTSHRKLITRFLCSSFKAKASSIDSSCPFFASQAQCSAVHPSESTHSRSSSPPKSYIYFNSCQQCAELRRISLLTSLLRCFFSCQQSAKHINQKNRTFFYSPELAVHLSDRHSTLSSQTSHINKPCHGRVSAT